MDDLTRYFVQTVNVCNIKTHGKLTFHIHLKENKMAIEQATFNVLLEAIERFINEKLVPIEALVDKNDQVPEFVISEMRELGLFGLSIPEKYGGLGLNMREEIEVAICLGLTTPAFRSVFGTNIGIGSQGIIMDGTEEQKAHYLPKLATGEPNETNQGLL